MIKAIGRVIVALARAVRCKLSMRCCSKDEGCAFKSSCRGDAGAESPPPRNDFITRRKSMAPKKKKQPPKPKATSKRKYALSIAGLVAAGAVVKALSDSGHIHNYRHGVQQMVLGDDPDPPAVTAVVAQALACTVCSRRAGPGDWADGGGRRGGCGRRLCRGSRVQLQAPRPRRRGAGPACPE